MADGGSYGPGRRLGLKRCPEPEKNGGSNKMRKYQHIEEETVDDITSQSSSEESSAEESDGIEAEEVIYKEPSMRDNLLKSLSSTNKSFAEAYKKSQRQAEGRSDSEENEKETDGSESLGASEDEDDSKEGIDSESPSNHATETKVQQPGAVGSAAEGEDAATDSEASDTDSEQDSGIKDRLAKKSCMQRSYFEKRFNYTLSKEEADNLLNKKFPYKWEVTNVNNSHCKWMATRECLPKDDTTNSIYGLKPKLYKHWLDGYKTSKGGDFLLSKQKGLFSLFSSYRDILHGFKKPFYLKGLEEDSAVMEAYLIHSLNHIFKTRDLVKKNNARIARNKEEALTCNGFLDQGFTRPKILILLPLRRVALRVVKRLIQLTPEDYKVNVEHLDRLYDDFGSQGDDDPEENMHENGKASSQISSKPQDFQSLFGDNRANEDSFMMGIKFTRKSIRLFSNFYSSDMIIASPVGLLDEIRRLQEKKEDVDYLSSIEVLIIDHADVISMQSWPFFTSVIEKINRLPTKQHGTDVMRIRSCYLDGHARFFRQTIVLSSFLNPDINTFFNKHCVNYQGKVKSVCENKGVLSKVLLQVPQVYERFSAETSADIDKARLEYFAKKVFPKIKDSVQGGVMLFISSYFEFVRLRNYLKSLNASFCLVGDYTKSSDISRARNWFYDGTRKIMLYTERFHFNFRYKIRGIQNLIFYSLPERKEFYPEILNMLQEKSDNMKCTVLFSRFDQLKLERIVGSTSTKKLIESEKDIFVFC